MGDVTTPEERTTVVHVARTTLAAVGALLAARLVALPEPYWAAISAIVVMQSSLGASFDVSWKRFAGTALGAVVATALAWVRAPALPAFAGALVGCGLLCRVARLDRVAYRFTGITLAIVLLVERREPAWVIAAHRFAEVSMGIAVALLLSVAWPRSR